MNRYNMKTPIVFLIFNRPETTIKVFEEIRRARPPKLFVVADGPRSDRAGEAEKCEAVRAIIDTVDWQCEVIKNYSACNLGCKSRISSGLDWVFESAEEAIILEDDCLPHPAFFRFCEEMLERYRDDNRIFLISGDNFQLGRKRTPYSYYFTRYSHIWGWATWRRSWRHYDVNISLWPEIKSEGLLDDIFHHDKVQVKYWSGIFDSMHAGRIDTWDYQVVFACLINSILNVMPSENLISNIGFGESATRTKGINKFANIPTENLEFPLSHPPYVIRDLIADDFTAKDQYRLTNLKSRISGRLKHVIG